MKKTTIGNPPKTVGGKMAMVEKRYGAPKSMDRPNPPGTKVEWKPTASPKKIGIKVKITPRGKK